MTGLEKIINQIQAEGKAAAQAVLDKVQEDCGQIALQAQREGDEQVQAIEIQAKATAERQLAAAESAAVIAKRRAVLEAKQAILSRSISDAHRAILDLPKEEYFSLLLQMVEAFSLAEDGVILFSPTDRQRLPSNYGESLSKAAKGNLRIGAESRNIDGGFVLVYGDIEENCSFRALFDAKREILQDMVQELLFS